MSPHATAEEQAEAILDEIDSRGIDLPPEIDVEDVIEVIDMTVPYPVNLNRVLEQLVED